MPENTKVIILFLRFFLLFLWELYDIVVKFGLLLPTIEIRTYPLQEYLG